MNTSVQLLTSKSWLELWLELFRVAPLCFGVGPMEQSELRHYVIDKEPSAFPSVLLYRRNNGTHWWDLSYLRQTYKAKNASSQDLHRFTNRVQCMILTHTHLQEHKVVYAD